jgi:hypothetical protein
LILSLLDCLLEEGKIDEVRAVIRKHLKATDSKAKDKAEEEDVRP